LIGVLIVPPEAFCLTVVVLKHFLYNYFMCFFAFPKHFTKKKYIRICYKSINQSEILVYPSNQPKNGRNKLVVFNMVCNFMVGLNMVLFSKKKQIKPTIKTPGKVALEQFSQVELRMFYRDH